MFLWWEYFFSMLISSLISSSSSYNEQEKKKTKTPPVSGQLITLQTHLSFDLLELTGKRCTSDERHHVWEILGVRFFFLFMPARTVNLSFPAINSASKPVLTACVLHPGSRWPPFNFPAQTSRRVLAITRRSASRWMCALFRSNATDCFHSRWDVPWLHL